MRVAVRTVALVTLLATPAMAVCPQPQPKVCAEFFKSDAVFVGTVIAEHTIPEKGDFLGGWEYTLRIEKAFRGPDRKTIKVFTENSSGRFRLEVGRQYLLFATEFEGQLVIGNCGNSALLSEAADSIAQIDHIQKAPSGGEISGRVVAYSEAPLSGIRIVAVGEGGTYTATTDPDGSFNIQVPPGKYTVRGESSRGTLAPYDLSYDDPKSLLVPNGGCAQVQFVFTPE